MSFLNSLNDRLAAMERGVQALPGELDAIVARLDPGKLQSVLIRLEQDCDHLYEKQSAAQSKGVLRLPLTLDLQTLSITPITSEDRSRWREAYRSRVAVLIGKGKVEVIAASEIAEKYRATVSQITIAARKQGYMMVSWDQYIKELGEIDKLTGE